ncbi:protocatechuate 3,4-dioxygenase subunit alpha [Roseomonas sp. PWR1]|uniref:Protocatechuate 3,4-dioxygenase subunit alpha n=1 Tax=Roseomonas nitratireducens TaxID=2820810 RepID=A0ABS4AVJ8_9PROT|nr:protocatechuate 3,4-dioxygenase subunit alpha [Neoroseomonas nitratireducens]MBP0465391.1 protocatechuate 3,4-dioxygenase subunit alpha [Neoroseomonas nitratireducens]
MIPQDILGNLPETPSQTAGPYVHIGLIPKQAGFDIFETNIGDVLVGPATQGERIRIEGRIFDGTGALVRDALVEIWQADAHGRFNHPADRQPGPRDETFRGWGRTGTDFETGLWAFETIKPGRVAGRSGHKPMAPHVSLWIVARGINLGLATRLYFGDEAAANAEDPVLRIIEQPARRETLIAPRSLRDGQPVYTLDIRLQGEGETVFFDV